MAHLPTCKSPNKKSENNIHADEISLKKCRISDMKGYTPPPESNGLCLTFSKSSVLISNTSL